MWRMADMGLLLEMITTCRKNYTLCVGYSTVAVPNFQKVAVAHSRLFESRSARRRVSSILWLKSSLLLGDLNAAHVIDRKARPHSIEMAGRIQVRFGPAACRKCAAR